MGEWQPIETAPKDGAAVLVYGKWIGEIYGPVDGVTDIACWRGGKSDEPGDNWWECTTGQYYASWVEPTHWQPLPEPPHG